MTDVYVGIRECGCLVAISDDKDWLEGDFKIEKMELEEARERLKYCHCKVAEQYPKVFEGDLYNFKVDKEGDVKIIIKESGSIYIANNQTHKALRLAIAESDKIRGDKN